MIELSCFSLNLMFNHDYKCNKTKNWFIKKASFYEATLQYNSNYSDFSLNYNYCCLFKATWSEF